MSPSPDGWLTTKEAAQFLDCAEAYIRKMARRQIVKTARFGRYWMIDRESLQAYKDRMESLTEKQKKNPWRADLAAQGRGRQSSG